MISRLTFLTCLKLLLCFQSLALSQHIFYGQYQDEFESIGIDENGTVFIVGRREGEGPGIFQLRDGLFIFKALTPLPGADGVEDAFLSRDAKYVASTSNYPESEDEATFWHREALDSPIGLGLLPGGYSTYVTGVASTPTGPLVVGHGGYGSFLWSYAAGLHPWITNASYFSLLLIAGVSADGTQFIGQERSIQNGSLLSLPFTGRLTSFEFLGSPGTNWADVLGISPSGSQFCGHFQLHSVVWAKGKQNDLAFGTNLHGLVAITDEGLAFGFSSSGPIVYDSHGKKAELFETWAAKSHRDLSLPTPLRRASDVYEWQGKLHFLMATRPTDERPQLPLLVIVPSSNGNQRNRLKPIKVD